MSTEAEQLEDREADVESMSGGDLVYRATDVMTFQAADGGSTVLEGRMMPYHEWTEVNSSIEGHFLERFAPGSLAKTLTEHGSRMRVLFEHGLDRAFGNQAIAVLDELRDESDGAHYRASLLDGLPPLLVAGLQKGLYGTSVRYSPVKWDRVRFPKRSEYNPDGIQEITVREARVKEISAVTFPQYVGATARVRSLTDEMAAERLLSDPARLLEIIEKKSEPQHSGREEQEAPVPQRSRSTQPSHDYLANEKEAAWLL